MEVPTNRTGIVIELKYAENGDLDAACEEALKQIKEKDYVAKLKQDGMKISSGMESRALRRCARLRLENNRLSFASFSVIDSG